MGLNVLFVGNRGGSLHSAQLVFDEDRTLANLDCGDTFDKAANFLLEHPGALFFYEEHPGDFAYSKALSRLITCGSPVALIALHAPSTGTVSSTVHVYKADESLRQAFIDGDVIRAIGVALRYCKELSQESRVASSKPEKGRLM